MAWTHMILTIAQNSFWLKMEKDLISSQARTSQLDILDFEREDLDDRGNRMRIGSSKSVINKTSSSGIGCRDIMVLVGCSLEMMMVIAVMAWCEMRLHSQKPWIKLRVKYCNTPSKAPKLDCHSL